MTSRDRDALGLSRASTGDWLVEVSRARHGGGSVRGRVTVTVLGERRVLPFTLTDDRARVGRVTVTREEQLVPM